MWGWGQGLCREGLNMKKGKNKNRKSPKESHQGRTCMQSMLQHYVQYFVISFRETQKFFSDIHTSPAFYPAHQTCDKIWLITQACKVLLFSILRTNATPQKNKSINSDQSKQRNVIKKKTQPKIPTMHCFHKQR